MKTNKCLYLHTHTHMYNTLKHIGLIYMYMHRCIWLFICRPYIRTYNKHKWHPLRSRINTYLFILESCCDMSIRQLRKGLICIWQYFLNCLCSLRMESSTEDCWKILLLSRSKSSWQPFDIITCTVAIDRMTQAGKRKLFLHHLGPKDSVDLRSNNRTKAR